MTRGSAPNSDLAEFSRITELVRRVFQAAHYLSPMCWLKRWLPLLRPRSELLPEEVGCKAFTKRRARAIENYMFAWLACESTLASVVCLGFMTPPNVVALLACAVVAVRIVEVVQVTVNATVFDALSGRAADNRVASTARMLVLAGINFLELCCCFGVVYALYYPYLRGAGQPATGFYFSVITQLTIGYGDVYPIRWLRLVAAIQGLVGTLFVVLVVARFVASMPAVRGILGPDSSPKAG